MKTKSKKIGRRNFIKGLGSVAVGSLIIPKVLRGNEELKIAKRHIILPPGAINKDNLNRYCTACHLCVTRCPEKILKPARLEYGLKGIQQPIIEYKVGFCRFDCIECGRVCPTGAIRGFDTLKEKRHTQIGIAKYNKEFCQINELGITCRKCLEMCPVNAVRMVEGDAADTLIPSVDVSKCIGCGACEYYCPTSFDRKAIWVDGLEKHKKI